MHNIPVITAAASTSNSNPVAAMMIEAVELTVYMCKTIMNHNIKHAYMLELQAW